MLVMLKPLGESLDRIYIESQVLKIVGELVRDHPDLSYPRGWMESMHVRYIGDQLYIFAKSVIPKDDIKGTKSILARLQRKLSSQLGKPVQISVTVIPVDLDIIKVGSGFKMFEPGK